MNGKWLLLFTTSVFMTLWSQVNAAEFKCELKGTPLDVTPKFELWLPPSLGDKDMVRGLILACDYNEGARIYDREDWRALAGKLHFGIMRHKLFRVQPRVKLGEAGPCADADTANAILRALLDLAKQSGHPEIANACFIHTGLSWSGQQAVGLADALPERSIGFVAYHMLGFGQFNRAYGVPGLLPVAEEDTWTTPLLQQTVISETRYAGSLWAGLYQPGVGHPELGDPAPVMEWIEEIVRLRLPEQLPADRPATLRKLEERSGWLGQLQLDLRTHRRANVPEVATVKPFNEVQRYLMNYHWLPSERFARTWQKFSSQPFDSPHDHRPLGAMGSPEKPMPLTRASGPITVDGDLAEWKDVRSFPAPFSGKSVSSAKFCWTETGLYGAVQAKDAAVKADPAAPWSLDAFELFIETDFARSPIISPRAIQILVAPGDKDKPAVVWPAAMQKDVQAAWKPTSGGYTVEFFIPSSSLAPAKLEAGTKLGFNFCLYNDGKPVELFFCSPKHGGFNTPELWGAVELTRE